MLIYLFDWFDKKNFLNLKVVILIKDNYFMYWK